MSYHADAKAAIGVSPKNKTDEPAENDLRLGLINPFLPSASLSCGIPLRYLSLAALAIQNSMLTIIMHYSRVSIPPSRTYSAATAVLMNELLKGFISLAIAFTRIDISVSRNSDTLQGPFTSSASGNSSGPLFYLRRLSLRIRKMFNDIFSPDCWKLSIPAILYVIQNNLQFVAISNLEAATFQVSYQLKILTTAAFSVILLRKQLSSSQWLALFLLAIGVGIVQVQSSTGGATTMPNLVLDMRTMNQMKGLIAVVAACFTSGLAGVYFEMVLKNSSANVWVRNVQLSLFSLLPALLPVIFTHAESNKGTRDTWSIASLFDNFGLWAWATVVTQVIGGLLTAIVIKYSDNIIKGFATSLSIILSFMASVALFNFGVTFTFLFGSFLVVIATWLYNQPQRGAGGSAKGDMDIGLPIASTGRARYSPGCSDDNTFCLSSLSQSGTLPESETAREQNKISTSLGSTWQTSSV